MDGTVNRERDLTIACVHDARIRSTGSIRRGNMWCCSEKKDQLTDWECVSAVKQRNKRSQSEEKVNVSLNEVELKVSGRPVCAQTNVQLPMFSQLVRT